MNLHLIANELQTCSLAGAEEESAAELHWQSFQGSDGVVKLSDNSKKPLYFFG
jgi:hypothetical protein